MSSLHFGYSTRTIRTRWWSARVPVRLMTVSAILFAIAVAVATIAITFGDYPLTLPQVVGTLLGGGVEFHRVIVLEWRMPVAVSAVVFGAVLGIGGAIFQSLTRNPLGSPDVIGFDAGSYTAVVVTILALGTGDYWSIASAAIFGGLATAFIVYVLAYRRGIQGFRLIIVGIAVSAVLGSVNSYLITRADIDDAMTVGFWAAGSITRVSWSSITPSLVIAVLIVVAAVLLTPALRKLELGDDTAITQGARPNPARLGLMIALPIVLVLMHLAARPLRRRSMTEQAGLADAAAAAADLVAGYRVIRGIHAQHTASLRYREVSRSALRSTLIARSARAGFEGLSTGTAQLFAATVAVAAAILAFSGQITVGQLVTVAGIAVALIGPLDSLVGTLGSFWAVSQASARRVLELLATEPNPASLGVIEPAATAAVRFEQLDLGQDVVLNGEVRAGDFVVITLPATAVPAFADVLSARAFPRHGRALYGETPTHECHPATLRARMLVVPHTPGVFSGTVLDNVRANGDVPVDADAARAALRVVGLTAAELPDGADTLVDDGGWELSGGQRQRVGVARGVAADTEVLVLLDPTTSVDAVTEQRIATELRAHRAGRTTIVVTGSVAFRAVADRVLITRAEGDRHG